MEETGQELIARVRRARLELRATIAKLEETTRHASALTGVFEPGRRDALVKPPDRRNPRPPFVLSVDDRESTLYTRGRLLRSSGFRVISVTSGRRALEMARAEPPHLILLDMYLADGDGRQVCRDIKQDPALAHVPVILISSASAAEVPHGELMKSSGADACIVEPMAPDRFISLIRGFAARQT